MIKIIEKDQPKQYKNKVIRVIAQVNNIIYVPFYRKTSASSKFINLE